MNDLIKSIKNYCIDSDEWKDKLLVINSSIYQKLRLRDEIDFIPGQNPSRDLGYFCNFQVKLDPKEQSFRIEDGD